MADPTQPKPPDRKTPTDKELQDHAGANAIEGGMGPAPKGPGHPKFYTQPKPPEAEHAPECLPFQIISGNRLFAFSPERGEIELALLRSVDEPTWEWIVKTLNALAGRPEGYVAALEEVARGLINAEAESDDTSTFSELLTPIIELANKALHSKAPPPKETNLSMEEFLTTIEHEGNYLITTGRTKATIRCHAIKVLLLVEGEEFTLSELMERYHWLRMQDPRVEDDWASDMGDVEDDHFRRVHRRKLKGKGFKFVTPPQSDISPGGILKTVEDLASGRHEPEPKGSAE